MLGLRSSAGMSMTGEIDFEVVVDFAAVDVVVDFAVVDIIVASDVGVIFKHWSPFSNSHVET